MDAKLLMVGPSFENIVLMQYALAYWREKKKRAIPELFFFSISTKLTVSGSKKLVKKYI